MVMKTATFYDGWLNEDESSCLVKIGKYMRYALGIAQVFKCLLSSHLLEKSNTEFSLSMTSLFHPPPSPRLKV